MLKVGDRVMVLSSYPTWMDSRFGQTRRMFGSRGIKFFEVMTAGYWGFQVEDIPVEALAQLPTKEG